MMIILSQIFLWMMLGLCCLGGATTSLEVYYITPEDGSCSVDGKTLSPCYSIQQLIEDNALQSSTADSVTLLLLSGTHTVPANAITLKLANFSQVQMAPLRGGEKVVIECDSKPAPSGKEADFAFSDIAEVMVWSIRFSFCSLQFNYSKTEGLVTIDNCTFEGSLRNYALTFASGESQLNVTVSDSIFTSNYGGLIVYSALSSPAVVVNNSQFVGNNAEYGGAIFALKSYLLVERSQFSNNTARVDGGAIFLHMSPSFQLSSSAFTYNRAGHNAGAILMSYTSSSQLVDSLFEANTGDCNGGGIFSNSSILSIDSCLFVSNEASYGGAIISADYYMIITNTTFLRNYAPDLGSAISTISRTNITGCRFVENSAGTQATVYYTGGSLVIAESTFEGNRVQTYGGALFIEEATAIITNCHFRNNSAGLAGGAIFSIVYANVDISGGSSTLNHANNGGFAYLSRSQLFLSYHTIDSNWADNGGGIYASTDSQIGWTGPATMTNNTAKDFGGALYLTESRFFSCKLTKFVWNSAKKGGAIFVNDLSCAADVTNLCPFCFITKPCQLQFDNNTALLQGPSVYGGLLDRCYSDRNCSPIGIDYVKPFEHTPLAITSDPIKVCLCSENHEIDCSRRHLTVTRMAGQTVDLCAAVVDQAGNPSASFIKAFFNDSARLGKGEGRLKTGNNCSKLSFHILTGKSSSATLVLHPEGVCEQSPLSGITVHIKIRTCSRGFENNGEKCTCEQRLIKRLNDMKCDINTDSVERQGSLWLRYKQNLKLSSSCPLDYCRFNTSNTISLVHPDDQCSHHRSGVLCGACKENYSIALGSSKCLKCTSNYSPIWLIPVFAVAGIALVAVLWATDMTVSHGTLNGPIFYANVISISGLTNLHNCSLHPILSVFIAWVNLDFGVETCFYSGMDTYQKTWLQFAFPLYIWLLVGAIVLVCKYSNRAMKKFGKKLFDLLATLFLLSYVKIFKTIIAPLNFTEVYQGTAENTSDQLVPYRVWTYNGNIEYLKGKHVPLFAVALAVLVLLFLPYTFLLTCSQWIQALPTDHSFSQNGNFNLNKDSRSCWRRNVVKFTTSSTFIYFMAAYNNPYERKHRYWTGLMLLSRCLLFLTFAFNYTENPLRAKMYVTILVLVLILALKTFKVYKKLLVGLLELCFLLNLLILSATVWYFGGNSNSSDDITCVCTSILVSVSLVLLAGIMASHSCLRIANTDRVKQVKSLKSLASKSNVHLASIRNCSLVKWVTLEMEGGKTEACDFGQTHQSSTTTAGLRDELQGLLDTEEK